MHFFFHKWHFVSGARRQIVHFVHGSYQKLENMMVYQKNYHNNSSVMPVAYISAMLAVNSHYCRNCLK